LSAINNVFARPAHGDVPSLVALDFDDRRERKRMHAMVLNKIGAPLEWTELPDREPGPGQVRVTVAACGVCRTDLHVVDGELPHPQVPIIPGHQIVGRIDAVGAGVEALKIGERVGIPWLGHTCGVCAYCQMQRENLCDSPLFTGYTRDGGYATSTVADARFAFALGDAGSDGSLAPLLCAGLIGWRARGLGATWAGGSDEMPPQALDAAIIFATVGDLVPQALKAVRKGGRVVCAGIHMSDIPSFPYSVLWEERELLSVANLTRQDGLDFLALVPKIGIVTKTTRYPLQQANQALADLRAGRFEGAAVLIC
jgi:propanol-preferring alcohol dehydrogenase